MRLILIRHGQSVNNNLAEGGAKDYDNYMAARSPEPPLTEVGVQQAELLAQHLAAATERQTKCCERLAWVSTEYPFTTLYTSPMLRALQTAAPIACALGLAPRVWVDIHEHGGIFSGSPERGNVVGFPGLTRIEMSASFPLYQMPEDLGDQGWWVGGYEEMAVCYTRAERVAATLRGWARERADETIALVTHGTFLDHLLHVLLLPDEAYDDRVHFSHLNTAVSRIDFNPNERVALRYLNRIDHLPPALITR